MLGDHSGIRAVLGGVAVLAALSGCTAVAPSGGTEKPRPDETLEPPAEVVAPETALGGLHQGTGAPIAPDPMVVTQPDGSSVTLNPFGDGTSYGYETDAGFTVVEGADGYWYYATARGSNGDLRVSERRADGPPPAGVPQHLREAVDPTVGDSPPTEGIGPDAASQPTQHTGDEPTLVLLVRFTDQGPVGSTAADWASRYFGASNSVADYYDESSYGQLHITPAAETNGTANDGVVGWLDVGYPHPNPGSPDQNDRYDRHKLVKDALTAADPYVNYAAYDDDSDGVIEPDELHISVIVAGYETSYGGAAFVCGPSVWGHKSSVSEVPPPTLDGTSVGGRGYTMFGEWHCTQNDSPGHMATIGIMVHEMGHDLGWPDLYDTDQSSEGVGEWSVMASGSWNSLPGQYLGTMPPHPDAFSKYYQGWTSPTDITSATTGVAVRDAATTADVVRVLDNPGGVDWSFGGGSGTGEYFLIENRELTGYDSALPGCGMLVWHIDETRSSANDANANESRRLVDLEEADGLAQLHAKVNRGDGGDPYPGTSGNTSFGPGTNPASALYSGLSSGLTATFTDQCSSTMHVDIALDVPQGPQNDSFADALAVAQLPFLDQTDTRAATMETGEPFPSCVPGFGNSLWYRLDGSLAGELVASTAGSDFDTVLAVYDGTDIGSLNEVGCNDDASGVQSEVQFQKQPGHTYYIQAGGYGGNSGQLTLGVGFAPPANDAFADAVVVDPLPFSDQADTRGATSETGEPSASCMAGVEHSVWYRMDATTTAVLVVNTVGSDFDTVLAVYDGTAIGSLNELGCNDDIDLGADNLQSEVQLQTQPGHTYYVQADGYGGSAGDLELAVSSADEPAGAVRGDFDGDGDSDVGVFRPSGSGWFVQGGLSTAWGSPGDVPVTGDFNGDGTADVAVFRPSDQTWYVQPSTSFPGGLSTQWGATGDIPVPADFNGDGTTDIAVFRPSDQTWYVQPSTSFPGGVATQWGITGDIPVPADFNGDGTDEVAVYRPSDQTWYSQSGLATQWGITGDIPVPVDFNGDGTDEVAVYRPSDQTWYSQGSALATQWGTNGDQAVPGDYDGDGTADVAVYRPSDQTWYVQGGLSTQWGTTGDIPIINPPATRNLY